MHKEQDITNIRDKYPERIDPSHTEHGILNWHLKKYEFALPYCKDRIVLDAGCGTGYGSMHLKAAAKLLLSGDIDPVALSYAKNHYPDLVGSIIRLDAHEMPFRNRSVDIVCSFENIEHLKSPECFLAESRRILKPDGILIVSTPASRKTTSTPRNPHHTIEWSPKDFEMILQRHFAVVEIYGQKRIQSIAHRLLQSADIFGFRKWLIPRFIRHKANKVLSTRPIEYLSLDDFIISRDDLRWATEVIAVCYKPIEREEGRG